MCTCVTCWASRSSSSLDGRSRIKNKRSKRDSRAAGKLMFSTGDILVLYRPYKGLAAARIEVRAFKVVEIPALEIEIVCCSMTSWMAVRSDSSILSNSSIQQIPLSASTRAPPSERVSGTKGRTSGNGELTQHHLVGYGVFHDCSSQTNA